MDPLITLSIGPVLYITISLIILILTLSWKNQHGKVLFCLFAVLNIVVPLTLLVIRLLWLYGHLSDWADTFMFKWYARISTINSFVSSLLLMIYVIVIWYTSRFRTITPQANPIASQPAISDPTGVTNTSPIPNHTTVAKRAHYGLWATLSVIANIMSLSGVGLLFLSGPRYDNDSAALGLGLTGLGMALGLWLMILSVMYVYRMWMLVPLSYARTSPGQAVGFLFIPFFNLYWVFQAYYGWAQDYNRWLDDTQQSHVPRASVGLFQATCILCILCAIPLLNYLIMIPTVIFGYIIFYQICRAINTSIQSPVERSTDAPEFDPK